METLNTYLLEDLLRIFLLGALPLIVAAVLANFISAVLQAVIGAKEPAISYSLSILFVGLALYALADNLIYEILEFAKVCFS